MIITRFHIPYWARTARGMDLLFFVSIFYFFHFTCLRVVVGSGQHSRKGCRYVALSCRVESWSYSWLVLGLVCSVCVCLSLVCLVSQSFNQSTISGIQLSVRSVRLRHDGRRWRGDEEVEVEYGA